MDITLIQDVKGFGTRGTRLSVADGYARSFLLPQKLAVETASAGAKQAAMENSRAQQALSAKKETMTQALADLPSSVTVYEKANENGVLFQAVSEKTVADMLKGGEGQYDITINKPIKEVGEHIVSVNGHDLTVQVLAKE